MEGLMTRAAVLAAILVATFAWVHYTPEKQYEKVTEDQMLDWAPKLVNGMSFKPSGEDSRFSYKMDEVTYKTLHPFGIVARIYSDGVNEFDAVMIMSRERYSFHDPRVCFTAQNWNIDTMEPAVIETKSRGQVPISFLKMTNTKTQEKKVAAFFYKGPGSKFFGSTQTLKIAMFMERLFGGDDFEGVFYRMIPITSGINEEQFKKFVGDFLDSAKESSKGRM